MADARDVLTDSEMCALRDVYTHMAKVDWAQYDSAITKIREHGDRMRIGGFSRPLALELRARDRRL
jgi:hypothetical protein